MEMVQGYDTRCVGAELVPQERVQLRTGARVGQLVLNAPVLQMSEEDSLLIARIKELQRTAGEGVRDDAWVIVTTPGKRPYYWHQRGRHDPLEFASWPASWLGARAQRLLRPHRVPG